MKSRMILATLAAVASIAGSSASASQPAEPRQASISYANMNGITDWYAPNDRELYVRDRINRWYLATLTGTCPNLRVASRIGFEPSLGGRFDNRSGVRVGFVSCGVKSLVAAERPAAKGGRH